jgi:hypothetical protein
MSLSNQLCALIFVDMPKVVQLRSGSSNGCEEIRTSYLFSTVSVVYDVLWRLMSNNDVNSLLDEKVVPSFWVILKSPRA